MMLTPSRVCINLRQCLFPERICPACGAITGISGFCSACLESMGTLPRCLKCAAFIGKDEKLCYNCQEREVLPFVKARAALPYNGRLRENILGMKYYNKTWLARPFADALTKTVEAEYPDVSIDLIVPVPLSGERLKSRGYNQAELLGRALSLRIGVPCIPKALKRVKDTPPLSSLSRQERLTILRNAFIGNEEIVKDKTVLLVDDIFTTGATAIACCEALKKAKSGDIRVVTVAAGKI